jgi:hypothetical protein
MADVRVLGASESPTSFTLSPSMVTIGTGATTMFTITTDIPAPTGGTTFTLSNDLGATVPAMVTVPADATTATFPFMASGTAGMGMLTAMGLSMSQSSAVTVTAGPPGHLVINEIDYDQPSADTAEFIELYNGSASAVDLTGIAVVLVNGGATGGPAEYGRIMLSGSLASHGYLVLAPSASTVVVPSGVTRVSFPSSLTAIQNGSPDGVALVDGSGTLLDALSYEGPITTATIGGRTYSLVEGTALPTSVADAGDGSLSRIPNGSDSDDAASDWMAVTMSTPGASNDGSM